MHNEFTAIIERDEEWYVAYCPEIPGANGQGRTKEEARQNLADAIALILDDRREDALRGVPADAIRETVTLQHLRRSGCFLATQKSLNLLVRKSVAAFPFQKLAPDTLYSFGGVE